MLYLFFLFIPIAFSRPTPPEVLTIVPYEVVLPKLDSSELRPFQWFYPATKYKIYRKNEGKLIYDNLVTQNNYGFRITESDEKDNVTFKNHLFFVGCSITFGQGVEDRETFSYVVSKNFPKTRVLNSGLRGAGIQDQIFFWERIDYRKIVTQEEGKFIFTLIPDHFARITRSWRYLQWAFPYSTVYKHKDGHVYFDGILEDKLDYKVAKFINSINGEYWWLRLTYQHSVYLVNNSLEFVADALVELRKNYLIQYPKGKFVVSWMRDPILTDEELIPSFKQMLKQRDIEFWEPSENDTILKAIIKENKWHIPYDGHPTSIAHKRYAEFLTNKLLTE